MNLVAVARWTVVGARWWLASDDPLGPVDQDPDQVHDDACHLVSADPDVCEPVDTLPPPSSGSGGDGGGGGGAGVDLLSMLFWLLLVAAVVLLVVVALRAASRRGWFEPRRTRTSGDGDGDVEIEREAVVVDRRREPTNWRDEADAHRREGRYRDALRCRYRALVGDLARRGLIDEIPGRTTGEERAQLRRVRPQASPPFDAVADLFDGAWYGHVDVDASDDDRFQVLERDVLAHTSPAAGERP